MERPSNPTSFEGARAPRTTMLQALLAHSADMITVSDRTGHITYASPATERVSGYTIEEFMAGHPFDTIHPDDRPDCITAFGRILTTPGLSMNLQHRIRHKDGTWHWVEGTFTNAFDDPAVNGLVATIRDITERKRAEAAARESEAKYRRLFDAIDEGFCIIEIVLDDNGRPIDYLFLETNPVFEELTGLKNATGRTALQLVPDLEPFWIETYAHVALTGEALRFESYSEPMGRWFNVHASRVGDAPSRQVAIVFTNITDRKRAEEEIAHLNQRNRDILESITDGFIALDRQWHVVYLNAEGAMIIGRSVDESLGTNLWEAFPGLEHTTFGKLYLQVMAEQVPGETEDYYEPFDSWINTRVYPSENGLTIFFRDITERKRAEAEREHFFRTVEQARAEAEDALKIRDQFLLIASHELRTPLTSLIGYTHLLERATMQGKEGTERISKMITQQAQRLNTLINQLLDVSRLQRGQFAMEPQPVDLAEVIASVVDEFQNVQPPDNWHPIELHQPDGSVMVAGDVLRLEQVITNVLSNATKYSAPGRPVRVQLSQSRTDAVLEVQDRGIGIPKHAQSRLFEPFYRAGNVGSQTSGFGIGLHIVGEIVQRHGGRIEISSTEGEGSTFRMIFPLLTAAP